MIYDHLLLLATVLRPLSATAGSSRVVVHVLVDFAPLVNFVLHILVSVIMVSSRINAEEVQLLP